MKKVRLGLGLLAIVMVLAACASDTATPTPPPTPDIDSAVRTAVAGALSTAVVHMQAAVQSTAAAPLDPTPMPMPTPISPPNATPTPVPPLIWQPRLSSEWTAENPATFENIRIELEQYRGQSLTIASWGGAYQAAQRQAYFLPFQERFGIQIVEDSPTDFAKVRSMVQTGNVTWDIVDSGFRAIYRLGSEGYLEEFTPAIHNRYIPYFPEVTVNPWSGGGGVVWSTGLTYRKSDIDELWGGKKPEDWTAFWDTQTFPGRRWMSRRVHENIFFAQFARMPENLNTFEDRAAIASLTAEQVDQSFDMLQEIKPHIRFWWTSGTDCPLGLLNNEVDMCTASNVGIRDAQLQHGGDNIHYCFECGHLNQADAFFIPKGSPKKMLAELFISWTAEPDINVNMANYITYGPLNLQALPLLYERVAPDIVANLPTSADAIQSAVFVDEKWLGDNLGSLTDRMQDLLAGADQ